MSKKTLPYISIYYLYMYILIIGGEYYAYYRHTDDVLISHRISHIYINAIINLYGNGT